MLIIGAIKESDSPRNKLNLVDVRLVKTSKLKPHEDINENNFIKVKESIINEGIKFPIIAEQNNNIILDGHHRFNIFKELKIKIIPVFYVDYFDRKIIVGSWNGKKLTKNQVIKIANSGAVYPSKTTKHMFKSDRGIVPIFKIAPRIYISIYELMRLG